MTRCSRKARRTFAMIFSDKSFRRSTPQISAPSAPEMRLTSTLLLDLDVRGLDDRGVALLLAPHEGRHFVRRARHRVEPEAEVALLDRKSTRLNSSHANISYAVFCLKKKTQCT